jgi:hypothetical protein
MERGSDKHGALRPVRASHGGVPKGMTDQDVQLRSEVAQALGKEIYPASGAELVAKALRPFRDFARNGWPLQGSPTRRTATIRRVGGHRSWTPPAGGAL